MPDPVRGTDWRRRGLVAAGTVVALGAGGYAAYAQVSRPSSDGGYRVAAVTRAGVSQTVTLTGTVKRVSQVNATFPVAGTVTGVAVQVGQPVTAGQPLATIDEAPLLAAVTDAQAQLAQAQAQLVADSTSATTTTAAPASSSSAGTGASSATGGAAASPPIKMPDAGPLQAAVTAMNAAAKAQTTACAVVLAAKPHPSTATTSPTTSATTPPTTSTTSPTTSATTPPTTSTTSTTTTATPPPSTTTYDVDPAQIAACVPALQAWSAALSKAQTALQDYSAELTKVQKQLAASSASTSTSGSSASGQSGSGTSSGSAGAARSPSGAAASSAPATSAEALLAKQLIDQAAIIAAEQAQTVAQNHLGASTLTAPISGVVGRIALTPGQGASSSQGITIVGGGAATVAVEVPLATMPSIKQGNAATVTAPGLPPLTGSVSQISLLPSSSTSSTPTYTVTVTLPDTPPVLATGSRVTTNIVTAAAANVLTIPASAVPGRVGGTAQVDVVKDGRATSTPVTLGAVGGGLVEVTSGLAEGDQVAVANLTAPLPTNQSQFVRGLTGGGGAGGGQGGAPGGQGGRTGGGAGG